MPTLEQETQGRALLANGEKLLQQGQQALSAKQSISSDSLTAATPMNIPPAPVATGVFAMDGAQSEFAKQEQAKADKLEQSYLSSGRDLATSLFNAQGEAGLTDEFYSRPGGVDETSRELQDINQQIFQEEHALRREVEAIQDNADGLTRGAVAGRVEEVTRASVRKRADLSVIALAKQGRYDSAKAEADRAINVLLERQKMELDYRQFIFSENKELFTKAEQRAFEVAQGDRERALNREEANLKTISDLSLNALQNGASSDIAARMRQAKTPEEAMMIGGQYVDRLDRQLKIAQINKIGLDNLIAEAAANDRKNGILDEKDIKAIDNSPQGKKVQTAGGLKLKLSSYQDLVKQYGFEISGPEKSVLENAYTELQLAYKEAANLGVLNGPDLALVESAIKSATPGFFGNVGNVLRLGQGTRNLEANLEQAQTTLNNATVQSVEELYARDPAYKNSLYVQSLLLPFGDELMTSEEKAAMDAVLAQ